MKSALSSSPQSSGDPSSATGTSPLAPLAPVASGTSASAPSVASGRQLGRYEILCELATGGMASVHIARAQGVAGFERLVAIKVLHPHLAHEEEFISMFLDEARLAARIRHSNVVATQDISDTDGNGFFLVMDYIEGDHLGSLLGKTARQAKAFPSAVAARCVIDALNGLAAAHELTDESGAPLNIVHRDISPHNILVGTDGVARLTDFGVAKAEVRMSSTRAGQFKGKLSYMAPEQASTGTCDQRSDLFAMGIILWESLTARRLFRGESNAATLSKILVDPIPAPSAVAPELAPWDDVLAKALARAPEERFQNAHEFVEAIEHVALAHGGIATARVVGALVKELIGEKVEAERARVHAAIVGNNAASGTQTRIAAIPGSRTPSQIPMSPTHSRIAARDTPLSGESSMPNVGQTVFVQESSQRTTMLLVTALVLVSVAAAAAGYFASRAAPVAPERVVVAAPAPAPALPSAVAAPAAAAAAAAAAAGADVAPRGFDEGTATPTTPTTSVSTASEDDATRDSASSTAARARRAASAMRVEATTAMGTTSATGTPEGTQPAMDTAVMTAPAGGETLIESNPYRTY